MATVYNIACYGDSITQGATNISDGAIGNFAEQWRGYLTNTTSAPPIIGTGFRGLWLSGALNGFTTASATDEWIVSSASDWTHTTATTSYNKAPHGQMWEGGGGSTKTATWQRGPTCPPVVGFAIHYIDGPSSGDWQYSIDGGAWTNMGQSNVHDNGYKKFAVMSSVSSSVSIRQYNGTSSATVYLVGIEAYYADPRTNDGVIFHNLGRFGFWLGVTTGALDAGADPFAFFDAVTLGSNAVAHTPSIGTLEFVNDQTIFNDSARWTTDLGKWWTRANATLSIPWVLFNFWEMDPALGAITAATQTAYRSASTTFSSGKSNLYLLDLFNVMSDRGFGGANAQGHAIYLAGYSGDGTHPSAIGNTIIAQQLLSQSLSTYVESPLYVATRTNTVDWLTTGSSKVGSTDELGGRTGAWSFTIPATPQTESQTATVLKAATHLVTVSTTQTQTPTITKATTHARTISVTQTQTPTVTKATTYARTISATDTQTPSMIRGSGHLQTVSATATQTPTMTRGSGHHQTVSVTQTQTPDITKIAAETVIVSATATQTATLIATASVLVSNSATTDRVTIRSEHRVTFKDVYSALPV